MNAGVKRLIALDYVEFVRDLNDRWSIDIGAIGIQTGDLKFVHKQLVGMRCLSKVIGSRRGPGVFLTQIPENSYIACVLALKGLGNPAYVSLRQMIELALKYIYFRTHPVEYSWVCDSDGVREFGFQFLNDYCRKINVSKRVNGIQNLDELVRMFGECSRYVHVHSSAFMTTALRPASHDEIKKCFRSYLHSLKNLGPCVVHMILLDQIDKYLTMSVSEQQLLSACLGRSRYSSLLAETRRMSE